MVGVVDEDEVSSTKSEGSVVIDAFEGSAKDVASILVVDSTEVSSITVVVNSVVACTLLSVLGSESFAGEE